MRRNVNRNVYNAGSRNRYNVINFGARSGMYCLVKGYIGITFAVPFQPIALHRSFLVRCNLLIPFQTRSKYNMWVMIVIIEQAIDSEVNQSMRQRAN